MSMQDMFARINEIDSFSIEVEKCKKGLEKVNTDMPNLERQEKCQKAVDILQEIVVDYAEEKIGIQNDIALIMEHSKERE